MCLQPSTPKKVWPVKAYLRPAGHANHVMCIPAVSRCRCLGCRMLCYLRPLLQVRERVRLKLKECIAGLEVCLRWLVTWTTPRSLTKRNHPSHIFSGHGVCGVDPTVTHYTKPPIRHLFRPRGLRWLVMWTTPRSIMTRNRTSDNFFRPRSLILYLYILQVVTAGLPYTHQRVLGLGRMALTGQQ